MHYGWTPPLTKAPGRYSKQEAAISACSTTANDSSLNLSKCDFYYHTVDYPHGKPQENYTANDAYEPTYQTPK